MYVCMYGWMDGWMDGLWFHNSFNNFSVMSSQLMSDDERL